MLIKVRSNTDPKSLAQSIITAETKDKNVSVQVVGAGALNQAIKAIIMANAQFSQNGGSKKIEPTFVTIEDGEGKDITAIKLILV